MENFISLDEFKKIDLRIGEILEAEFLKDSEKLIKIVIYDGKEKRQIMAGIGKYYKPEELIHKKIVFVANLEPKIIRGEKSEGMLLAAQDEENKLSLLFLDKDLKAGAKIS